ncbi:MAG: surface-adhesin E family protein [Candidatus Sulfotelmatobacter sp.]
MRLPPAAIKKGSLILCAVVLAPVLLAGVVAVASSDWRQIGATSEGDQVLVSSVTLQKNGLRSAWIRVEYKEPAKLPQGGPFVELRARVRFNCNDAGAGRTPVTTSEWFYSRDHSGRLVVSKKTRRDDQFGQTTEGGFGEIARDFVCNQK